MNVSDAVRLNRERAILAFLEGIGAQMQKFGITNAELARRLGIDHCSVSKYMHGPNFTFETAAGIADAVGLRFEVALAPKDPVDDLVSFLRENNVPVCLCMTCKHQEDFGLCSKCHCCNRAAVYRADALNEVGRAGDSWLTFLEVGERMGTRFAYVAAVDAYLTGHLVKGPEEMLELYYQWYPEDRK